jgi:hypothetical protein
MSALFKESRFENPRLLASARGKSCCNCGIEDGTVVSAHSNKSEHGKGKGLKSHDIFIAYLCHRCHSYIDNQAKEDATGVWGDCPEDRERCFTKAMHKTWLLWARWGWIKPSV